MPSSFFILPNVGVPRVLRGALRVCRKVRRRLFIRNLVLGLVRHAVRSLNTCGLARLGSGLLASSRRSPAERVGVLQASAHARLFRSCRKAGLPPRQSPREALCELLKMQNLEPDLAGTTVAPFAWNKLKLLRDDWEVSPREVRDIAPDHVAKFFEQPAQSRLSK